MDHPLFSRDEMLRWQRRLLRSFYLRPRIALRLMRAAYHSGELRGFARSALAALGRLAKA